MNPRLRSGCGRRSPGRRVFERVREPERVAPRTPLLHPGRYFADREYSPARTLALLGAVGFAPVALGLAVGTLFAAKVDGTVLVDNPDRPPEPFCETNSSSSVFDESDCAAPAQVERNVDTVLWSAVEDVTGQLLVGAVVVFGLLVVAFHVLSLLSGGEGPLVGTVAVTAWGLVPTLALAPVAYATMWVVVDPVTVTRASSLEPALAPVLDQLRSVQRLTTPISLAGVGWAVLVWRAGLRHRRGLDGAAATVIAVGVGLLLALGALA